MGLLALLLLNIQGKTIDALGTDNLPDQYKEPTYQLDFNVNYRLDDNVTLTFQAENLLNPEIEYTQGGIVTRSYRDGRKFSIGLEYVF